MRARKNWQHSPTFSDAGSASTSPATNIVLGLALAASCQEPPPALRKPALCSALLKAQGTCYVLLLLTGKFTPFLTDVIVRLMTPEERLRANRAHQHEEV